MKLNLMALSVAVAALFLSTAAKAQTNCADRAMVVERLGSKYGESRRSVGVAANNSVVEMYAHDGTGSWSIVVTMPDGRSCLVASGMSYETLAEVAPASGNDA